MRWDYELAAVPVDQEHGYTMKIERYLKCAMRLISQVSTRLAMLSLASLVALFILVIALRPFGVIIPSADDLGSIMLAGILALGMAAAVVEDEHIEVRFFVQMLPSWLQQLLILVSLVLSIFVVGLVLQGVSSMWLSAFRRQTMMLGSLPIPRTIPLGVVLFSVLLFQLSLILRFVSTIFTFTTLRKAGEE